MVVEENVYFAQLKKPRCDVVSNKGKMFQALQTDVKKLGLVFAEQVKVRVIKKGNEARPKIMPYKPMYRSWLTTKFKIRLVCGLVSKGAYAVQARYNRT